MKIHPTDNGETNFILAQRGELLVIQFPQATRWIALKYDSAIELANMIINSANIIRESTHAKH